MESENKVTPLADQVTTGDAEPDNGAVVPDSVFEELRRDHSQIGRGRTQTVDVPGYHGNLRVRYKWVAREELTKRGRQLVKKVSDPDTLDLLASCDTLITTCDEILVVVGNEEKPLGDPPVTFSNHAGLLKHLGIEADTAREAVRVVFNNDFALIKTALAVSRWLEDTSKEVDLESLGF